MQKAAGDHATQGSVMEAIAALSPEKRELAELLLKQQVGERYRASHAQRRMWFLHQMEPRSTVYNIPVLVRIEGPLNQQALKRGLNELIRRHQILRTRFVEEDGEPVQVVDLWQEFQLDVRDDLEVEEGEDVERAALEFANEMTQRPFDLSQGPLMRAQLILLGKEDQLLVLAFHHIVWDMWSGRLLISELTQLYHAYSSGMESPLPDLEIQYGDYAEWEYAWVQGEAVREQLRYWGRQLKGLTFDLELPADHPRRGEGTRRAARVGVTLPVDLCRGLRKVMQDEGVTLFMALLAGLQITLCRYSGQREVAVGSPVANRNQLEIEGLIGCFVNMVVMRGDLRGNPTLREALRRVKQAAVNAYSHADAPLQMVVEELRRERGEGLFQVTLGMQESSSASLDMAGLKFRFLQPSNESVQFDLRIAAEERGDEVGLWVSYPQEVFEATTIERMLRHLEKVLRAMVETGEQRVWEMDLLSPEEKALGSLSGRLIQYQRGDAGIAGLFEQQVELSREDVAIELEGQQLTYGALNERANQLAHALRRKGVGVESRVGVCMERGLEMIVGILGVLKAGGAYVPLDPEYPHERLNFLLEDAGLSVLLVQERTRGRLNSSTETLVLDGALGWEAIREQSAENISAVSRGAGNRLAYVIYTSGTTGQPKGVMVAEEAILYRLRWAMEQFPLDSTDRVLQKTVFTFDASVWELLVPLMSGARLVMARHGGQRDSRYLVEEVQRAGITVLQLVPSMLGVWLQEPGVERCGKSLKWVFSGGEALTRDLVERFRGTLPGVSLENLYGPTEASIDATHWSCVGNPAEEQAYIPLGKPLHNAQVYIANDELALSPVGVIGEIYIGGAGLARGYVNQPELTAERFVPNPFSSKPGERLYRTGDRGRYDADGVIHYAGRSDEQVKVRGYRIEPGEIEAALAGHEAVKEAAVTVQADGSGEKRLVAFVVLKGDGPNETMREAGLKEFLSWRLPEYMIPGSIVELEQLPHAPNGKLDRRALPHVEYVSQPEYVAPRSGTAEVLAQLWGEVLKIERVGAEDNFFDLGGHSLLATQLMARVRETFGVEIGLAKLFEDATVEGLAAEIEKELRGGIELRKKGPIAKRDAEERTQLSYSQQRLWFLEQLEPGGSAYNLSTALVLEGELHVQLLEQSLNDLIKRHEMLRTRFELNERGEPEQIVGEMETSRFELKVEVVDGGDDGDKWQEVKRLAEEEQRRPFDLGTGPLLRVRLLRVSEQEHVALFTLHHIISDGWSQGVAVEELGSLYTRLAKGEGVDPEPLTIQYGDYAAWQRDWLRGDLLDLELEYWKRQMEGMSGVLALPTDRARPVRQSYDGADIVGRLEDGLGQRLQQIAREENVTLYMLLLASLDVLLWRYSGQTDIAVGSPVANRTHKETEKLIGFFVNTLVLRNSVDGKERFTDFLKRVRETALGAYAHQDVPFERVVEELRPERDLGRSPLFQVMFVLQNLPPQELQLPGLKLRPLETESTVSKFDLTFSVSQLAEGGLQTFIEYNTALYDRETIERMWGHWEQILRGIAAEPHRPVRSLQMMKEPERRQVIEGWNSAAHGHQPVKTIVQLFEEQVQRTPDRIALSNAGEELTYEALNRRANQIAHYITGLGVCQEKLVGIAMDRSLEMMVAILGVLKAGGAYIPMDPAYPVARLEYMLQNSNLLLVITCSDLLGQLPVFTVPIITMDIDAAVIASESEENLRHRVHSENAAYVIYTSGSTGRPKGVIVTHGSLGNFLFSMSDIFGDPPTAEEWIAITSISFDISILELFWTLTRGDSIQLHHGVTRLDPGYMKRKHLEFSLFFFSAADDSAKGDAYRLLLEGSRFADENGFKAVWIPERHFHAFGGLYPNPSVTGAALAVITKNLEIRAGSVVMPLHDPLRTAEEWSVVDNLSGGRAGISFASGWQINDFVLSPERYADRKNIMLEQMETVRALWRGESISRINGAGNTVSVSIHPSPIQSELPVWLTAAGNEETFRLAGEMGAGLLTHLLGQTVDELAHKISVYRTSYHQAGHKGRGSVTLMLHTFIGVDEESTRSLVRGPFCRYLEESVGLLKQMAIGEGINLDPASISRSELDALLALGFDRYYQTSSLMGDEENSLATLYRLAGADVDEVGCLIDFGVPTDSALDSLQRLARLKERWLRKAASQENLDWKGKNIQCTPSFAQGLLSRWKSEPELPTLGKLLLGGENLSLVLASELQPLAKDGVFNMYGPTETTIWSAAYKVTEGSERIPIGRPIANTEIYLLDEDLEPVPIGLPGELYIGGSGLARGYLGSPDTTADRFIPHPFSAIGGARVYRTGDIARYLPDGNIEFLARVDQQSKIRGYRIEPGEIETLLLENLSVAHAAVMVREDSPGDRRLVAYVVLVRNDQRTQAIDVKQLREYLRGKVPEYMVPDMIVELDEFPLTPNGKLDRKAFPFPGTVRAKKEYIAPRTEVEEVLAMVWGEFLHVERVGVEDNFFELGGHSLLAAQLVGKVTQIFRIPVSLQMLFSRPTLGNMASALLENEPTPGQADKIARLAKPLFHQSDEDADAALAARSKEKTRFQSAELNA
jgi:natural product biosynthesis luciferase-like monooxygenase protein/amino acid adenylation domain-containing protein